MWLAATILRGKRNPWPLLPVRDRHIESLFFYWHTLRAMPTALVGWGKMKRGREATKGTEGEQEKSALSSPSSMEMLLPTV